MEKENLKITSEYFNDLGLYHYIIERYNSENVLLEPFYAENEEELHHKAFKAIAEYEREEKEEIIECYEPYLQFYWQGIGYYDIQGICGGIKNGQVIRIEDIMSIEAYDIDLNKLLYPELIEEEFGGKVYGVFGCNTVKFPPKYKTKYIIVDDVNEGNEIKEPFSILEEYGIEPHAFGVRGANGWHNYVWQRAIELNNDRLIDFLIELYGLLPYDDVEIIYLSKLKS